MKKLMGIVLLSVLAFIGTGCMRVYETFSVNDDETVTVTIKQAISKAFYDEMGSTPEENDVLETLEDGEQYYTETISETGTVSNLISNNNVTLTKDIFYYKLNSNSDETVNSNQDISQAVAQNIYVKLTVNLADDIVDTNANVTEETTGKTAVFDTTFLCDSWYAYTAHGKEIIDTDTTAPVVTGIEDGKHYKTIPEISVTDDTCTVSANLNGKPYSLTNIQEGENIITVTDIKGNTTTVTFYRDSTVPTIKGVKNGKSYKRKATVYVKDNLSLSTVTVNGKKQKLTNSKLVKSGKYKDYYKITIKKKGKYTIVAKDNTGNKSKIKIKIK